ncbi:sensor domain-containing diguanylate cyclase [Aurantimonas sp. Leaf443]|uniref:GGDEF domain-containing protein n=1 Tax=Aurantimonas sp. Leaf443 TaxID=1736378 RepID=UPI00329849E0
MSPVPLWLNDFSAIKALMDGWRAAGVTDLRAFLAEDRERVRASAAAIRVLDANPATLALFGADSLDTLVARIGTVLRGEMLDSHVEELVQLYEGRPGFTTLAVNYTLDGRRLDVQLKGRVVDGDWGRVLVSTEDVTERESARRAAQEAQAYIRGLFDHSPVSLWVEDFSAVHELMQGVRASGVVDFRTFLDVHPEFVRRCMSEVRVVEVNRHTLEVFGAPDMAALLHLSDTLSGERGRESFSEQLVDLWTGKLFQQREVTNVTLGGEELHFHMQFSVFPGHEHDWSLVQIALTDITARKRAEAYLEFLGKHDVLTKLYNRSYLNDEMNRLERKRQGPVAVIVADLNGLKEVNDTLGHAAGDDLLRRAGEVLAGAVKRPGCAARIGGDEFALLLPGATEASVQELLEQVRSLVEINNQFYTGSLLDFALGHALALPGERLENAMRVADHRMYEAKRTHYLAMGRDRRARETG